MSTKEKSPRQTVNIENSPCQVKVYNKLSPCPLKCIKKLCSQRVKEICIWLEVSQEPPDLENAPQRGSTNLPSTMANAKAE